MSLPDLSRIYDDPRTQPVDVVPTGGLFNQEETWYTEAERNKPWGRCKYGGSTQYM